MGKESGVTLAGPRGRRSPPPIRGGDLGCIRRFAADLRGRGPRAPPPLLDHRGGGLDRRGPINQSVISSAPIKPQQPSFMSDLDVQLPSAFDPFAEANAEDSGAGPGTKDYVHVRIQQRNGRKSLTTVQGLKKEFSYNKILKDLKKEFCCNGTVVQDPELGQVIQLQGDQRKNVATFLVQAGIAKKENIKIHGF
ncbi:protein translation factor SUI1 [Panicum miliaceum]|nr:protein translation factor SUI1 [Panicum miliaceum]